MQKHIQAQEEETLNLRQIIEKYTQYWQWIVLSLVVFVSAAFLILRYSSPVFQTNAKILVEDSKDQNMNTSNLSIFKDLGILSNTSNIENEIEIIKSRSLAGKVATQLNLQTTYYDNNSKTGIKNSEIYLNTPIQLVILDSIKINKPIEFSIHLENTKEATFNYSINKDKKSSDSKIRFNHPIKLPFGTIEFRKSSHFKYSDSFDDFIISHINLNASINQLLQNIEVNTSSKESSVLILSTKGEVPQKNEDILNRWIQQHDLDKLQDKQEVTSKTSKFINERMKVISLELSDVDIKNLTFKKSNKLVDVQTNALESIEKESGIEKEIIEKNIQLEISRLVSNYLDEQRSGFEVLPSNLGFEDKTVGEAISFYNDLVLKRAKYLQNSTANNPLVKDIENQLVAVRKSLTISLKNIEKANELQLRTLQQKEKLYNQHLSQFPGFEKEFRDIQREQQIKETLYLYLLQKREENEIAAAANITNLKVIDYAYTNSTPVSPKKSIILLAAVLLGILFPIAIIYVILLLDTKVKSPEDIEEHGLTFLGSIPTSDIPESLVSINHPKSPIAEAFRILRTNASFMLPSNARCQTIFITSTMASEGKTYISSNLAHTLALTGKKVILIGLDLRSPKLGTLFNISENKGVSTFLADENILLKDLIYPAPICENFDVLPAGPIPPNPSELLLRPRFETMLNELKEIYDYILFDTTPASIVADAVIVNHFADLTLYIVRAKKMDKRFMNIPVNLIQQKKLKNVGVVLNCADLKKSRYGYGYGYGYGE